MAEKTPAAHHHRMASHHEKTAKEHMKMAEEHRRMAGSSKMEGHKVSMKQVEKSKEDKMADKKHGMPEGSPMDKRQDEALRRKMEKK